MTFIRNNKGQISIELFMLILAVVLGGVIVASTAPNLVFNTTEIQHSKEVTFGGFVHGGDSSVPSDGSNSGTGNGPNTESNSNDSTSYSIEVNNSTNLIPTKPDLYIRNIGKVKFVDDEIIIGTTIVQWGNISEPFNITELVSGVLMVGKKSTVLEPTLIKKYNPGLGSTEWAIEFKMPIYELPIVINEKSSIDDQKCTFTVIVDPNNEINESNEYNNRKLKPLKIGDLLNGKGIIGRLGIDPRSGNGKLKLTSDKIQTNAMLPGMGIGTPNLNVEKYNVGIVADEKAIIYGNNEIHLGNLLIVNRLETSVYNGSLNIESYGTYINTMCIKKINEGLQLTLNNVFIATLEVNDMCNNSNLIIRNSIIKNVKKENINGRITYINSEVNGVWYDYYVEE